MATKPKYQTTAAEQRKAEPAKKEGERLEFSAKPASTVQAVKYLKVPAIKKAASAAGVMSRPQSASEKRTATAIVRKAGKPEWQMTAVEKMELVREGVSKKDLETLKSRTSLDYDKLSTLLATTRATLINKKGTAHFSATLSERIVGLADIYSYGFEVFEDQVLFNEWVFRPNQALGGKKPFELLDNQFGREEVKNVIGRIDYGVYS